jgi:hypothetical protein
MPEFTEGVVGTVAETPANRIPGVTGEVNPPQVGQPSGVDTSITQSPQTVQPTAGEEQVWTVQQVREFQSKKDREVAQWRRQAEQTQAQLKSIQSETIVQQETEYANQLYAWALEQKYDPGQSWPWAQQMARQEFAKLEQQQRDQQDALAYRSQRERSGYENHIRQQVDLVLNEYQVSIEDLVRVAGDLQPNDPNFQLKLATAASRISAQRGVQSLHQQATSTLSHTQFPGVAGAQGGVVIPDTFPKRRRFSKDHEQDLTRWRKQLNGEQG